MPLPPDPAAAPYLVTSSRVVYENRWTRLVEDRFPCPGGGDGLYATLAPIDAAMVCPLFPNGDVVLVRQWRHGFGAYSWELPCGRLEGDESAARAARRELAEEAGLGCDRLDALGATTHSDARVGGRIHNFLARELGSTPARPDATEADLVSHRLPLVEALELIDAGRIVEVQAAYLLQRVARLLLPPLATRPTPTV